MRIGYGYICDSKKGDLAIMRQRLNITLPQETIRLIDRATKRRDRSRFIDDAVRFFVKEHRRADLRAILKEGAIKRAKRDLGIAEAWFLL